MSPFTSIITAAPFDTESRRGRAVLLLAFAAVMAGRLWFLAELPILSRDGAMYCQLAQSLSQHGAAALRSPEFDQHPLFPLAIVGVQKALRAAGLPDTPLVWQRAGQVVAFFAGGVVVLLIAELTRAARQRFLHASSDATATVWAVLLAGALPLNVWLSSDVMSEPLFLAFYLGAIVLFLRPVGAASFGSIGVLSGLAFLVRPEGIGLLMGAFAAAIAAVPASGARRALAALAALALGFGVVATPYWATLGGFSPKMNKATIEAFQAALRDDDSEPRAPASEISDRAAEAPPSPALQALSRRGGHEAPLRFARLTTSPAAWYAAPTIAAYETCRAGRVVVPLLALPLIIALRRRLLDSAWLGVVVAAGAHFGLCTLLRYRHGYLDPRHTLPVVELLIPLAALALVVAESRLSARRLGWVVPLAGLACCGALAAYCLKERDTKSVYLLDVAQVLRVDAAARGDALLTGSSTHRRVAFHAGMQFFKWPEDLPTEEQRLSGLRDVLGGLRPTHFVIETGDADEHREDENILARLLDDPPAGVRLTPILTRPFASGKRSTIVRLYRVSYDQP